MPVLNWVRRWWLRWNEQWTRPEAFDWKTALAIVVGSCLLWPLTNLLPMLGYDWFIYFWQRDFRQYPQWVEWALAPLLALDWRTGFALLNAILLMSVAIGAAREVYRVNPTSTWQVRGNASFAALLALLTPPVFVLLWVGNIDGLALAGILIMPVGLLWLSLKPHLGLWATLARRSWVIWGVIFCVVMLIIFPGWPIRLLDSIGFRIQHPSAFGWASLGWPMIPIGLLLLAFTPADPIMLMAAGSFLSPFLMPQHFILLTPAFGRVQGYWRVALWAASWLLIIPLAFAGLWNGYGKALALGYPLLVWFALRRTYTASPAKEARSP